MVFSSLSFLCIFLPVVFLLHQVIPGFKGKNALLIVASLLFYAYGEPIYVVLMLVSTVVNWLFGLLLGKEEGEKTENILLKEGSSTERKTNQSSTRFSKKLIVAFAVIVNIGLLGVFKYADMVVATFNALTGLSLSQPNIALPIGISFYTFQAMSYVIDVYRGGVKAQTNYGKVLLYIAFFPQLIAGPIVRYHDVDKQLDCRHASLADIAAGLRRFCLGLAKKVLIANTMAATVDSIYSASFDHVNIIVAWIAAIAYLMQIYFDFSGYSDMAIGMARMFGFHYKENFNYPYKSTTIKEFWRRWHISLSTWLKEYLYIPLGGNRKGKARTVCNKIIVFFLCGLWHGASWTFVVWGLIHGFFLLLEELLPIHKLPKPLGWLYCMLVVTVAFVLFRADSFAQGGYLIAQMFTGFHFEYAAMELALRQLTPVFLIVLGVALVGALPVKITLEQWLQHASQKTVACAEIASYIFAFAMLVICMLTLSGGGYNPFIYFRF